MRTWSVEQLIDQARHTLRTLERITRPPPLGHDVDAPDGADALADAEAAIDAWEPYESQSGPCPNGGAPHVVGKPCTTCLLGCCVEEMQPVPPPASLDDVLPVVRDIAIMLSQRTCPNCERLQYYSRSAGYYVHDETALASCESVADYMARAERVESGYIIHDVPSEVSGHPPVVPPSEGQPTFAALQAITEEILRRHVMYRPRGLLTALALFNCHCGHNFAMLCDYTDHVAEIVISAVLDAQTVAQNTAAEQDPAPNK